MCIRAVPGAGGGSRGIGTGIGGKEERGVSINNVNPGAHAFIIRTSKFWPSLVVLKFLHNLSLNCS